MDLIWAMVIVGGRGNNLGALVGTAVIVIFYNSTRFLKDYINLPVQIISSFRMVVIGLLIILVLLFMREGLIREKMKIFKIKN